jgi:hypothetical protein
MELSDTIKKQETSSNMTCFYIHSTTDSTKIMISTQNYNFYCMFHSALPIWDTVFVLGDPGGLFGGCPAHLGHCVCAW